MASPVGEANWIAFLDQRERDAHDFDAFQHVDELFSTAEMAEPGSLNIPLAHCDFFWELTDKYCPDPYRGTRSKRNKLQFRANISMLPPDQLKLASEYFSRDNALKLWEKSYRAVKFRLSDSHELWNKWLDCEMDSLDEWVNRDRRDASEPAAASIRVSGVMPQQSVTPGVSHLGIRRITQLYKERLAHPHAMWEETKQAFWSFLSRYSPDKYETEMQEALRGLEDAKRVYALREPWEEKLLVAAQAQQDSTDAVKHVMTEYLAFEVRTAANPKKDQVTNFQICMGLHSRAFTGVLAENEEAWINCCVLVSSVHSGLKAGRYQDAEGMVKVVPNMLDLLSRAVCHIPWSGQAWSRYILSAEESGLGFAEIERIKHAATSSKDLDKDGMTAVLDLYSAWCGYLKRRAMDPNADEEAVDVAELGLRAALEDVAHWGNRRCGDQYEGDRAFRLEKILIQFLTEKRDDVPGARGVWENLAGKNIHAESYDFWLHWFLWEMVVFAAAKSKARSPTPQQGLRVPKHATEVFDRALKVKKLDWPERIMEVYIQHCNDYELPEKLREAQDQVYKVRKAVAKRREREYEAELKKHQQAQAEAQQAYAQAHPAAHVTAAEEPQDVVMAEASAAVDDDAQSAKRKREVVDKEGEDPEEAPGANKRAKNGPSATEPPETHLKRDREHTSVFVTDLPDTITATKVKQFFREYGHVDHIDLAPGEGETKIALVEFRSVEDAQTALIRHGKQLDGKTISVSPATDCVLYVTNFPPSADEAFITKMFKKYGDIFGVRFPNKRYNNKRRFCYATFRTAEAAKGALKLDGKLLEDGQYRLLVKLSDPTNKQQRQGGLAEGREVYVSNLPRDVTESDVETIFSKAGKVESVRLLLDDYGFPKGSAFVVMENKEQAQDAVAKIDKLDFKGKILTVETSVYKLRPERRKQEGTADSGPQTGAKGAQAEDDAADTAKHDAASSTTDKSDKASTSLMIPPQMIRRPVLGGRPKRGGRTGLAMSGGAGARDKASAPSAGESATSTNGGGAKSNGVGVVAPEKENNKPAMSNADFKKVFLEGKKE